VGDKKTVSEIALLFGVTEMGVRYWLNKGLPCEIEKVIGVKPRKVISVKDVETFLKLGITNEKKA